MISEKHLTIAYKLMQCRDTCRKFYAEGWKAKQEEWRPLIQAVMAKEKCDLLNVATIIGSKLEGFSLMTCLGVIMEMLESEK